MNIDARHTLAVFARESSAEQGAEITALQRTTETRKAAKKELHGGSREEPFVGSHRLYGNVNSTRETTLNSCLISWLAIMIFEIQVRKPF